AAAQTLSARLMYAALVGPGRADAVGAGAPPPTAGAGAAVWLLGLEPLFAPDPPPPHPASAIDAASTDTAARRGAIYRLTADSSHNPSDVKPTITTSIQYCERAASRASE
ncbi:MAG: hypothetical protein QOF55_2171, partial [Thermoleophilaceae bacterium]|nr:hypothetical protein [Thermoleophilaceae bacterium]